MNTMIYNVKYNQSIKIKIRGKRNYFYNMSSGNNIYISGYIYSLMNKYFISNYKLGNYVLFVF